MGDRLSRTSYLFTSESVSEGHPDKVCDRISDEIVDLYFREGPKAGVDPWQLRVACETMATTNQVVIAGETRGPSTITKDWVCHVARLAIKDIGYEQAARPDPVDALLVLLDLLEGQSELLAKLLLAHAEQHAAKAYPAADVHIDRVGSP